MQERYVIFILTALVVLLCAVVIIQMNIFSAAHAGGGGGAADMIAVCGNYLSNTRDVLYVVDTTARVICVYDYNNNAFNLVAARNVKFDFQLDEYKPKTQNPSVKDVYETTRKKDPGGNK